MKRLGRLQMNTWMRALLAGALMVLGSLIGGMGFATVLFASSWWYIYGWALLLSVPFLVFSAIVLIWIPYRGKGKKSCDKQSQG